MSLAVTRTSYAFSVIGFSGDMGAGKTSAAKILAQRGYRHTRFAEALKRMSVVAGFTEEQANGDKHIKAQPVKLCGFSEDVAYRMIKSLGVPAPHMNADTPYELLGAWTPRRAVELMGSIGLFPTEEEGFITTPRKFQQLLGTEWGRTINKDFWTNWWKTTYRPGTSLIVVDDVRFPNEVDIVHQYGGRVIEVWTDKIESESGGITGHASEQGVVADFRLYNERKDVAILEARIDDALILLESMKHNR